MKNVTKYGASILESVNGDIVGIGIRYFDMIIDIVVCSFEIIRKMSLHVQCSLIYPT